MVIICTSYFTFSNSCIFIYEFFMVLAVNSDYFLKQNQQVDLCNGEAWCSLLRYGPNVFTFALFLREGRAGVAWEPSNKIMFFYPSENKVSVTSPLDLVFESTLHLYVPPLSLSLRLQRFKDCT
jgi:hypothetical protein